MHAIRREIVIPPLCPVRNDRRARDFKPLNGLSNRIFIERSKVRILAVDFCDSLGDQEVLGYCQLARWVW